MSTRSIANSTTEILYLMSASFHMPNILTASTLLGASDPQFLFNRRRLTAQGRHSGTRWNADSPSAVNISHSFRPLPGLVAAFILGLCGMVSAEEVKPVAPTPTVSCKQVEALVKAAVTAKPESVLKVVAAQLGENPSCACEVIKAAIVASKASAPQVALIVDEAIATSPENIRLITQCALAVAPDALANIQELLERLDLHSGDLETSAKSSKGGDIEIAKMAADSITDTIQSNMAANPLDRLPLFALTPQPTIIPPVPPSVLPPVVTRVDP
jgi:hypothetical protein